MINANMFQNNGDGQSNTDETNDGDTFEQIYSEREEECTEKHGFAEDKQMNEEEAEKRGDVDEKIIEELAEQIKNMACNVSLHMPLYM